MVRERKGDVMAEAEDGVMYFKNGKRAHQPRMWTASKSWKIQEIKFSLVPPEENSHGDTSILDYKIIN